MYTNSTDNTASSQGIAPPAEQRYMCSAYGCPLPGGMSSTIGPDAKFYCRFHFQSAPSEHDRITHKLRMNLALVDHLQIMQALATDATWLLSDDYQDERQRAYRFTDYPKKDGMDHWGYVDALRAELHRRASPPTGVGSKKPVAPLVGSLLARLKGNQHISTYLPNGDEA